MVIQKSMLSSLVFSHDPMQNHNPVRMCSHAGDSDDAFYSPKSNASFSDGSFTSTQEVFGRSPSEDLDASTSGAGPQVTSAQVW